MTKILFVIHDLGVGGAEKVLLHLVNHLDPQQFDVTVLAVLGGGIQEPNLAPHVKLRHTFPRSFPGNSHLLKLLSPAALHRLMVREHYDIEVAYTEGVPVRIVSGCTDPDTKTIAWVHCTMKSEEECAIAFRSFREAQACYRRFDRAAFVSRGVREAFLRYIPLELPTEVVYNTNNSRWILEQAAEAPPWCEDGLLRVAAMGKVVANKGFDRLARVHQRLTAEGLPFHCCILGDGADRPKLEQYLKAHGTEQQFTFLGYQTNPYKYLARCGLFVCSSFAEGFSTAATEALILGVPVLTTRVSGMEELLGDSEFGLIVENSEEGLYQGLRRLLTDPDLLAHYRSQAAVRGGTFQTRQTVAATEGYFHRILEEKL